MTFLVVKVKNISFKIKENNLAVVNSVYYYFYYFESSHRKRLAVIAGGSRDNRTKHFNNIFTKLDIILVSMSSFLLEVSNYFIIFARLFVSLLPNDDDRYINMSPFLLALGKDFSLLILSLSLASLTIIAITFASAISKNL